MKMTKKLIEMILDVADDLGCDISTIDIRIGDEDVYNNNTIHPAILYEVEKRYGIIL